MKARRIAKLFVYLLASLFILTRFTPAALAFPHSAQIGTSKVYSEQPIDTAQFGYLLQQSEAHIRASDIYASGTGKNIYLTQDSWRWRLLALQNDDAFAVSFPAGEAIVINHADVAHDRISNGARLAGQRSLSGVLAHERTHSLIRARYGLLADARYPAWLREGYADVIAQESSLSDEQASQLVASGRTIPALSYFLGRRRVERELADASVDTLFERYRQF